MSKNPTNKTNLKNLTDLTSPTDNISPGPINSGDFSNWREPESEKDEEEITKHDHASGLGTSLSALPGRSSEVTTAPIMGKRLSRRTPLPLTTVLQQSMHMILFAKMPLRYSDMRVPTSPIRIVECPTRVVEMQRYGMVPLPHLRTTSVGSSTRLLTALSIHLTWSGSILSMLIVGRSKPLRVRKMIAGRTSNDKSRVTTVADWIRGLPTSMASGPSLPSGPPGNSSYSKISSKGRRSFRS